MPSLAEELGGNRERTVEHDIESQERIPLMNHNFNPAPNDERFRSSCYEPVVYVKQLQYERKSEVTLKAVDLTVRKGEICALTGPPEPGRDSLLWCILGLAKSQGGMVRVFGQDPGTPLASVPGSAVGNVPRSLSPDPRLTIPETLRFHGKLHGMPEIQIKQRTEDLGEIFEFPTNFPRCQGALVMNFSPSLKFRTSLATALIHCPPLLILKCELSNVDEPLLRKKIWNYLVSLAHQSGTAILIVTEDYELARQADSVAFLKSGQINVQDSPDRLLRDFQCETLKEVFSYPCFSHENGPYAVFCERSQRAAMAVNNSAGATGYGNQMTSPIPTTGHSGFITVPEPQGRSLSYARMLVLWKFALKQSFRSPRHFWFGLPLLAAILVNYALASFPAKFPLAVVNGDANSDLSQSYLESLPNHTFLQIPYSRLLDAYGSRLYGETWGILELRRGFANALREPDPLRNDTGIVVVRGLVANWVGYLLAETVIDSLNVLAGNFCVEVSGKVDSMNLGFPKTWPAGIVISGITAFIFHYYNILHALSSTTDMMRDGSLERRLLAGVAPLEIVVSHLFSEWSMVLLKLFCLPLPAVGVFETRGRSTIIPILHLIGILNDPHFGSLIFTLLLILGVGLQGVVFGFLFGILRVQIHCKKYRVYISILGFLILNFLFGGMLAPIEPRPERRGRRRKAAIRFPEDLFPLTGFIEMLRYVNFSGHLPHSTEFWASLLYGLIGFTILAMSFIIKFSRSWRRIR